MTTADAFADPTFSPRECLLSRARDLRARAADATRQAKELPGEAADFGRRAIAFRGAAADFEAAAALIPEME